MFSEHDLRLQHSGAVPPTSTAAFPTPRTPPPATHHVYSQRILCVTGSSVKRKKKLEGNEFVPFAPLDLILLNRFWSDRGESMDGHVIITLNIAGAIITACISLCRPPSFPPPSIRCSFTFTCKPARQHGSQVLSSFPKIINHLHTFFQGQSTSKTGI